MKCLTMIFVALLALSANAQTIHIPSGGSITLNIVADPPPPTTEPTPPPIISPPAGTLSSNQPAIGQFAQPIFERFDTAVGVPFLAGHPSGIKSVQFKIRGVAQPDGVLTSLGTLNTIGYILKVDGANLAAGIATLSATVTPNVGKVLTTTTAVMIRQDSPNLTVIKGKKVTASTIPPTGKYLLYDNCELTFNDWNSGGVWATRTSDRGWIGNVMFRGCTMHDVGRGYRDGLMAINCSVNHLREDAYSDIGMVVNCKVWDVGPIDSTHHADAAQFQGDTGPVVNSIIDGLTMRGPNGEAVNGQGISYSGGRDMLVRNCTILTAGGNAFYCDSRNGPITNLYIRNSKFDGGFKGMWLPSGTSNVATDVVIQSSNLNISSGAGITVVP